MLERSQDPEELVVIQSLKVFPYESSVNLTHPHPIPIRLSHLPPLLLLASCRALRSGSNITTITTPSTLDSSLILHDPTSSFNFIIFSMGSSSKPPPYHNHYLVGATALTPRRQNYHCWCFLTCRLLHECSYAARHTTCGVGRKNGSC